MDTSTFIASKKSDVTIIPLNSSFHVAAPACGPELHNTGKGLNLQSVHKSAQISKW